MNAVQIAERDAFGAEGGILRRLDAWEIGLSSYLAVVALFLFWWARLPQ
jgi:hypothetical protein